MGLLTTLFRAATPENPRFNLNDPLTGRLESRLSVDSVQSLEVSSGAIPAEFGKGSAATMAVKTDTGDDKLRYSGTNFVPGVASHKGLVLQDWTPRFGLSGPIEKGRAWFSDSADAQYTQHVIEELPRGHDRTASWNFSNLLHTQVNLTPSESSSAPSQWTSASPRRRDE